MTTARNDQAGSATMPSSASTSDRPDWQPTLRGERILLRPIRAEDLEALHAAGSDPRIWEQHSARTRHERPEFERYVAGAIASGGGLVVAEACTGRIVGSSRFYDWNPADRSVVIGYTFLERAHWGTGTNHEMKRLMLDHAFRWAEVAFFHASPGNLRSRRALERIGARLHAEQLVIVDGVPSQRVIYVMRPGDLQPDDRGDKAPAAPRRELLADLALRFAEIRRESEKAIEQLDAALIRRSLDGDSNSVAVIMKHVGGNLRSRFTSFLAEDGEKPWRDREREFVDDLPPGDAGREAALDRWREGWSALEATLASLSDANLSRTVRIRGEQFSVMQALARSLAHLAYHQGQITLVARILVGPERWRTISIPRGGTDAHHAAMGFAPKTVGP